MSKKSNKKSIYKSVYIVEVLSDEPIPETMSIQEIERECDEGEFSGKHTIKIKNKKITGLKAVKEVESQGSSVDFFNMDENGNEYDIFHNL